ncbi:hypothetical protein AwWohl_02040 [Gammaproteobacteria bacterium]|nr:hypothetical protein AwWohl_02040 [Gammaproteobacteria bacterium]
MLSQVIWSILLIIIMVTLHALWSLHILSHLQKRSQHGHRPILDHGYTLIWLVLSLLCLHFIETAIWAAFYFFKQGFADFATSLYFSIVSYATIGYGDKILPENLRLIGAIEGLTGTILAGWSVALLVTVLQSIHISMNKVK